MLSAAFEARYACHPPRRLSEADPDALADPVAAADVSLLVLEPQAARARLLAETATATFIS